MNSTLLLAGAHRGGESFSRVAAPALRNRIRDVLVADPVGDRANALATFWRGAGLRAQAKAQPAEQVVKGLWPEGVAFVAVDKPAVIAKVIERGSMIPVRWQLLARASHEDAPVVGFVGTILPGDRSLRAQAIAVLRRLSMVVPDQSSSAIWGGSAFEQDALGAMRRRVSEQSVREIASLEERPTAGRLELFCGTDVFPLRVERLECEPPEWEAVGTGLCALKVALEADTGGGIAVAVLPERVSGRPSSVQLFVVEGQRVRVHQEFGSAAALTD